MNPKLKFFQNVAEVGAYIEQELVSTLADDTENCKQNKDTEQVKELNAKIHDIELWFERLDSLMHGNL